MGYRPKVTAVGIYVILATLILGIGSVGAQSTREVEIAPTSDFAETGEIAVRLNGLEEFEGGTAAIYLCANADSEGNAIMATAGDCFAPGDDGYVFGAIEGTTFEAVYTIQVDGIGANESQCLIPAGDQVSCQLVVATSLDGNAKITGLPVDALLVELTTVELVESEQLDTDDDAEVLGAVQQEDELAQTGLSRDATVVMLIAAGLLVYLGYLFWSAAAPARELEPAHVRN